MRRLTVYTLFTSGPRGRITNRSEKYGCAYPWMIRVRASSIRQGYALLAQQVVAHGTSCGVVSVDRKQDSLFDMWPWVMPQTLYPQWKVQ